MESSPLNLLERICINIWNRVQILSEVRAFRIALFIWLTYVGIITVIVAIQPDRRTVTNEYRIASQKWWEAKTSLYRGASGYLYLPQFAVFYSGYKSLPQRVGEPLWRITGLSLLAGALWAVSYRLNSSYANRLFLVATVLALPSSFASARNGQVNLPLAALFIWIALAIVTRRWWLAAIALGTMLMMKPIIVAPMLVFTVLYPPLRVPLAIILIALGAVIFVHPDPQYVASEYIHFAENLCIASTPKFFAWCDFSGILYCLGIYLSTPLQFVLRAIAGLLTLLTCRRAVKIEPPLHSILLISMLCVIYLMLFNPRTETNSYVMLGPFVGLTAAYLGVVLNKVKQATGLLCIAYLLGAENYGNPIFPWTNFWMKPLLTLLLGILVAYHIFRCTPKTKNCLNQKLLSSNTIIAKSELSGDNGIQ